MKKDIATLPWPLYLDKAGLDKGRSHDRQDLGFILPKNGVMRIRQINNDFQGFLHLRLLNDDDKTEKRFTVGAWWTEASTNAVSVPFIDTPYTDGKPVVEIDYPIGSILLPIYRKGDNENVFFAHWDRSDAAFALIQCDFAQILVPKMDKGDLKSLPCGKTIDELIGYYERLFTIYNNLAGLSFNRNSPATDINSPNRYFMKADKDTSSGVGAYYGQNWTAQAGGSVSSFWLEPCHDNWGSLHEIGHGYEGPFMDGTFAASEVWNNIYAAHYQDLMLGDRKYQDGWLYSDLANLDKNIPSLLDNKIKTEEWGHAQKLYLIMLMLNATGPDAFSDMNQRFRQKASLDGFDVLDYSLLGLLAESGARRGKPERIDLAPFIRLAGHTLTDLEMDGIHARFAKAVYPLYQFVSQDKLEWAKEKLNLKSSLALVSAHELSKTKLKGSLTLLLNIDNLSQIYNKDLEVLDGEAVVFKQKITTSKIVWGNLPIGLYRLRLPTGRDQKYHYDTPYIAVRARFSEKKVQFIRQTSSIIASQTFKFLGLSNGIFATLKIDHQDSVIRFDVTSETPHNRYDKELYVSIIIRDKDNNLKFSRHIMGTNEKLSHDEIAFKEGYTIEIFHDETPGRLRIVPYASNIINKNSTTNQWEIRHQGLYNTKLKNDPASDLRLRIEAIAVALRSDPVLFKYPFSRTRDSIYTAIGLFDSPERARLLKQYSDCLPYDNEPARERSLPYDNEPTREGRIPCDNGLPYDNEPTREKGLPYDNEPTREKGLPYNNEPTRGGSIPYDNEPAREGRIPCDNEPAREKGLPYEGRGNDFSLTMKGENHQTFLNSQIDTARRNIFIECRPMIPSPHNITPYASIRYIDYYQSRELFSYDIWGNQKVMGVGIFGLLPTSPDLRLYLSHNDPEQLILFNHTQDRRFSSRKTEQAYRITDKGLEICVEPYPFPELNENLTAWGNRFTWTLKSDEGRDFCTLFLDHIFNFMCIQVNPIAPHSKFVGEYASLLIKDRQGQTVYQQSFFGRMAPQSFNKTIWIQKGYTVTVMHQDPYNSVLTNDETKKITRITDKSVTAHGVRHGLWLPD